MLGGRTDAQVDPVGWDGPAVGWQADKKYNRGHLLGGLLGGSNEDPRNFATLQGLAALTIPVHASVTSLPSPGNER